MRVSHGPHLSVALFFFVLHDRSGPKRVVDLTRLCNRHIKRRAFAPSSESPWPAARVTLAQSLDLCARRSILTSATAAEEVDQRDCQTHRPVTEHSQEVAARAAGVRAALRATRGGDQAGAARGVAATGVEGRCTSTEGAAPHGQVAGRAIAKSGLWRRTQPRDRLHPRVAPERRPGGS